MGPTNIVLDSKSLRSFDLEGQFTNFHKINHNSDQSPHFLVIWLVSSQQTPLQHVSPIKRPKTALIPKQHNSVPHLQPSAQKSLHLMTRSEYFRLFSLNRVRHAPLHRFCPVPGLDQTLSSQSREPKSRPFNSTSSTQPKPHAQDPRTASGRDVQTETAPSNPVQGWQVPASVWSRCY